MTADDVKQLKDFVRWLTAVPPRVVRLRAAPVQPRVQHARPGPRGMLVPGNDPAASRGGRGSPGGGRGPQGTAVPGSFTILMIGK